MRHARLVLPTPIGPSTTMKRWAGASLAINYDSPLSTRPKALGRNAPLEPSHPAEPGHVEVRGDVRERIQNPVARRYPGMRNRQRGIVAALAPEHEQVEVDNARPPFLVLRRTAER